MRNERISKRWQLTFVVFAVGGLWLLLAAKAARSADADADNPFATPEEKAAASVVRTWNDKTGSHKIEAKLLKVDQGSVVLKRTDGKEISVPLERLSDDDQKFVAKITGAKPEAMAGGRSLADDATGDKPSDVVSENPPNGTPALTLTRTDYRKAKPIDLLGSDASTYAPDVSSESQQLPTVRVPLKVMDFTDWPTRLLLLPCENKAFVIYFSTFNRKSSVQLCNLQSKQVDARAVFAEEEVPLDISPDGALVLSQGQKWGDPTSKSILLLYRRQGNAVKAIKEWKPFSTGEDSNTWGNTEVKWAQFADAKHLLAANGFGKLICWEVPELRPVWETKIGFGNEPVISAGRKYVAFASTEDDAPAGSGFGKSLVGNQNKTQTEGHISILNVVDGTVAASIPMEDSRMCSMAMRDDGKRLAIWQMGRIRTWDLESKELVRDFALQGDKLPGFGSLAWTADNYLLLNGGVLVDVERRIPIWNYNRMHDISVVQGGKVWFLDDAGNNDTKVLASASVPHKEALAAVANLKADDLLVVRPGMDVALDVQINGDTEDVDAAKRALEERLTKNGMKVVPESTFRLIATVHSGENRTVKYYPYHFPRLLNNEGDAHECQVTTQVLSLSFQNNGETLWKYESSTSPPGVLHLKEGETTDQALQRCMKQQEDYFPKRCTTIWIPAYVAHVPGVSDQPEKPKYPSPGSRQRDT